jgi:hypothetical protein
MASLPGLRSFLPSMEPEAIAEEVIASSDRPEPTRA